MTTTPMERRNEMVPDCNSDRVRARNNSDTVRARNNRRVLGLSTGSPLTLEQPSP